VELGVSAENHSTRQAPALGVVPVADDDVVGRRDVGLADPGGAAERVILGAEQLAVGMGDAGAVAGGVPAVGQRPAGAGHGEGGGKGAAEPVIACGHALALEAVEPRLGLKPADVVIVEDVAGLGGGEVRAPGDDFAGDPAERVMVEGEGRAVALAQRGSVADEVVIIFLIIARVGEPAAGLRREGPAFLAVVAVIAHLGAVAVGVGHRLALAVAGIVVAGMILLERRREAVGDGLAPGALDAGELVRGVVGVLSAFKDYPDPQRSSYLVRCDRDRHNSAVPNAYGPNTNSKYTCQYFFSNGIGSSNSPRIGMIIKIVVVIIIAYAQRLMV
jgi:hypothetical protein